MLPRRHRGCRHGPAPCRLLQHHSLHVLPPCRREQSLDVLGGMLPRLHAAKARSKANLKSLQLAGASAQHIPVHPRPSLSTSQLLKERRHPTNHRYPHPAIQAKSEKSCCRAQVSRLNGEYSHPGTPKKPAIFANRRRILHHRAIRPGEELPNPSWLLSSLSLAPRRGPGRDRDSAAASAPPQRSASFAAAPPARRASPADPPPGRGSRR